MPGAAPVMSRQQRRPRRRGLALGPGIFLGCMGIAAVFVLGFLITAWLIYDHYSGKLEAQIAALETLSDSSSFETTVIYDRDGQELYQVFDEGLRTRIPLEQIPQHVIDATISIEDDSFYQNEGVDIPSIVRAAGQYLRYGYIVSGGSTITQQLIRNTLFDVEYRNELTLNRKIDEALLAMILTQKMGKDDILELYLNEIYYGNLAYGIEAAAQTYFGKPAANLTLGEAALLAGLPQAPADLDPLNPDPNVQRRVMERRRLVLDLMVKEGYITEAEASAAYAEPLTYAHRDIRLDAAPHFVVYAQDALENLLVNELGFNQEEIRKVIASGGLQVYTTVDMDYQRLAENVARNQVAQLKAAHNMNNASVVILRPDTGEILAMVGSVDYDDESIDGNVNMAVAPRQPGSAMKPFTYAAALEKGWTAGQVIWDTEIQIGQPGQAPYVPRNYDGQFHGPVRLREALGNSYNIPAVQTLRYVGVDYLLWMMSRVGVTSLGNDASHYGLSLTLGGGEVPPLELTTAYSVLANGGVYVPHRAILCITNTDNEILYEYEQHCPVGARLTERSRSVTANARQVLDPRIAFIISDILADNNARTPAMGANSPLHTPGLPTSVKTGTTNDFKDNWTVGFTRNIAIGVWTGNTDNASMVNVSGLQGAAPIWHDIITGIYGNQDLLGVLGQRLPDDAHLQAPGGVSSRQLCTVSGTSLRDPALSCSPGAFEWMLDSPATAPDGNGNLVPQAPTPPPQTSANGPQPVEIEPGVIRVAVYPVAPDLANAIAAADTGGKTVPPRYCQVPIEVAGQVPGVQEQLFLAPPPEPDDAFYARRWAQAAGVAILPQYACNEQMLSMPPGGGSPVVVANIVSPAPGQEISASQPIDIVGSAMFSPQQAEYYKVEIRGGPFAEFQTINDIHREGVANGVLERIGPYALPPGEYVVQLVIVGRDGNWLQQPYVVPFRVTG
jgi:penicillin-binding protein 1C